MIPGMYNGKHMLQSQQVLGEEMGTPKAMTMLEAVQEQGSAQEELVSQECEV